MIVNHQDCSNARAAGEHNALQKKQVEKTWLDQCVSKKKTALSNQNTLLVWAGKHWASLSLSGKDDLNHLMTSENALVQMMHKMHSLG